MQFHLNSRWWTLLLIICDVPSFFKHCLLFSFFSVLEQKQIDLRSMLGVYIVLIGGMVLAFITLMAEMYWERRLRRRLLSAFRK